MSIFVEAPLKCPCVRTILKMRRPAKANSLLNGLSTSCAVAGAVRVFEVVEGAGGLIEPETDKGFVGRVF